MNFVRPSDGQYPQRLELEAPMCPQAEDSRKEIETLAQDLAGVIGEQSAVVLDAMDRWFAQVMERLEGEGRQRNGLLNDPRAGEAGAAAHNAGSAAAPVGSPSQGRRLAWLEPRESWSGWEAHQHARLLAKGVVEVQPSASTPGVVSPSVPVSGGSILKVSVAPRLIGLKGPTTTFARVVDQNGHWLGPEIPLEGERAEFAYYVPKSVQRIKIYLLARRPSEVYRFAADFVTVESHEIDEWRAGVNAGKPVIASLASIPSRTEMLEDCVLSLLAQCDRVRVFLNGYSGTPEFLRRERVDVRRSQSFDERGDAGKFAWIDADDPPGYRVVVDDDLIFSPNFVAVMTSALQRYGDKAVVGVHGILLKQPVVRFYSPNSRRVFHYQSALPSDRVVHVLGTNSICFHSSAVQMRPADFMWPNMADIFLARYAQRRGLPLIAVARAAQWVISNRTTAPIDTIYDHSLNATGSKFDTSWIQDLIVKACEPLTTQFRDRPKAAVIVLASEPQAASEAVAAWRSAHSSEVEWALVFVDVSEGGALQGWFAELTIEVEAHFIVADDRRPAARVEDALALCDSIGASLFALVEGAFAFRKREWIGHALAILAPWASIVVGAEAKPSKRGRRRPASAARRSGLIVIFSRERYRSLPKFDARATTLDDATQAWLGGLGEPKPIYDDKAGARWEAFKASVSLPRHASDLGFEWRVLAEGPPPASPALVMPRLDVNAVFEQILVINLDRRADRWAEVSARLEAAELRFNRVAAVDGRDAEILAEYETYRSQPPVDAPDARNVSSSRQFYSDYDSQMARAAYQEANVKGKAIRSPGAWAYLKTWKVILESALRERRSSLLVFDDDVVLHKQAQPLFAAAAAGLPSDWLLLQLGSLQHHWEPSWIRWRSAALYSTNGFAVGSHAVGLRFEVMPYLLDQVNRMLMPFDIGALSATVRAFSDRCFVVAPNVAIQALQDSDIGSSDFQRHVDVQAAARTYRWRLEDYDFAGGRRAK